MFNKTRSFISGILLGFYLTSLTLTSGLQSGGTTAQGINDGLVYVVGEDGAKIFYDATSVIGAGALVKGGIKGAVKSIGKKNPTGQLDDVIEQGTKSAGSLADDGLKGVESGIKNAADKAEHLFGSNTAKHNFDSLLGKYGGDAVKATSDIGAAAVEAAKGMSDGMVKGMEVVIKGEKVMVDGVIKNGAFRLGTAYIKP